MKNEPDFGYFGKGMTGYVHYMQTYKQCFPDTDTTLFSGKMSSRKGRCSKSDAAFTDAMFWFLAKLGPYVFAGFLVFFLMIHEVMSTAEMVQVFVICGVGFASTVALAIVSKDVW